MRDSLDDLVKLGPQRAYSGRHLEQIAFPLGGIGTGCVCLSGRGGLVDWSIFNRPGVGNTLDHTFPLVYARERGKAAVCRVAMAPAAPPFVGGGGGDPHHNAEGLPHLDACTFRGEYPFAWIDFTCAALPVALSLEAYNPFVPGDPDASGFPAAVLRYTLRNRTRNPVDATLAWSVQNPVGSIGAKAEADRVLSQVPFGYGGNVNRPVEREGLCGLEFSSVKWPEEHPRFGSLALATPEKRVTVMTYWKREGWFGPRHELWDTFSATGTLPDHDYGPSDEGMTTPGALGVQVRLKPRETRTVVFYLTWYFPNFEMYWHGVDLSGKTREWKGDVPKPTWRNYYASQFAGAFDAAVRLHAREKELLGATRRFHAALFGSTLPPPVLDAVASNLAILKSPTVLRLEDGTFYGFEGCAPSGGCCTGSCTHVWNYQQALPFLFPSLERSMREADYRYNLREDGGMGFRLELPLGVPPNTFMACADGQLGGVIKAYRDWKISGDSVWLRGLWPAIKRALEYAWKAWDPERRGYLDGAQHNTYDIEFHGPNPLCTVMYLGALAAAAEIADYLGDGIQAAEYRAVLGRGQTWVEDNLFQDGYYAQLRKRGDATPFQFGTGCLSDQLLGQWLCSVAGLGHVLRPARVRQALKSIVRHNFRQTLRDHENVQRVYALQDEAGLLLCSWPKGGRPKVPFPYSDEVWTGIEYQVASHCLGEGLIREGLALVGAARDRFDGLKRNPWDEFECGHYYARAMSSYGLLLSLSGFVYNKGLGVIGFEPRIHPGRFQCFWALDGAWGEYRQNPHEAEIVLHDGALILSRVDLPYFADRIGVRVSVGRKTLEATLDAWGSATMAHALHLKAGQTACFAFARRRH